MPSLTSGDVFSDTLRDITHTKLAELSKRRATFESASLQAINTSESPATPTVAEALSRLQQLVICVKNAMGMHLDGDGDLNSHQVKNSALQSELKNLERFLAQAQYDPSISFEMIQRWTASLVKHLKTEGLRFQYATLYGELVTEWLQVQSEIDSIPSTPESSGGSEDFEDVDKASKIASRMRWERMVFEAAPVDETELKRYLEKLFGGDSDIDKKPILEALTKLRHSVTRFETQFASSKLGTSSLRSVITGLLSSGHMSEEQKHVLEDIERNPIIQTEISDVLNMRKDALKSWSWGEAVLVQQQRQITGRFNISITEDLLQAMFLQYIGVEWSVFLKRALRDFRKAEDTWKENRADMDPVQKQRLRQLLGRNTTKRSLQKRRLMEYRQHFFVARLLQSRDDHVKVEDGEEEVQLDYTQTQTYAPGRRKKASIQERGGQLRSVGYVNERGVIVHSDPTSQSDDEDDTVDTDDEGDGDQRLKKPMDLKQRILHLLSADLAINKDLYGELTVFHSGFEDWYPQMPHSTIKAILSFFGFSDTWLDFFARYLAAPLRFADEDRSTTPRLRRRGSPAAHVLSDVFSELMLFNLDFAINQTTNGNLLWRYGDDFWFWSSDREMCVRAWRTIETFSKVTGTSLHRTQSSSAVMAVAGKSGSVRVGREGQSRLSIDPHLPKGPVSWGFLILDPATGRFIINDTLVDEQTVELQKQLADKRASIFGFIQTWNTFADRFFNANFGKPSNGFGRSHVDGMLAAHARIQRKVFEALDPTDAKGVSCVTNTSARPNNIIDFLKATIRSRFGVDDIPDGWFYFPQSLGGLNLSSPFVSLLQRRDAVLKSSEPLLAAMHSADERAYRKLQSAFLDGTHSSNRRGLQQRVSDLLEGTTRDYCLSFEDFVKCREDFDLGHDCQVGDVWETLAIKAIEETSVDLDELLQHAINALGYVGPTTTDIHSSWHAMKPYWKWVTNMYGPEIVERFGGLQIIDNGALPMGMVSQSMGKRVTWKE